MIASVELCKARHECHVKVEGGLRLLYVMAVPINSQEYYVLGLKC